MKLKRKIGKKIPLNKAIEGKVPVAWETSKPIPDIPYSSSTEVEDFDWSSQCKYKVKYKICEEEPNIWDTIGIIDELVFAHATLQNVDFEWGMGNRPYRFQPKVNVCEKVKDLTTVKKGKETEVIFEMATEFETLKIEKCKIKTKKTGKNKPKSTEKENVVFDERLDWSYDDPYSQIYDDPYSQKIEEFAKKKDPLISSHIKYKLSEEESEVWGLELVIPELVYENVPIQDVKFEYGSWGRSVRIRPDVRGKEVEHQKVKTAEKTEIVFEIAKSFPAIIIDKCKIIEPERVRTVYLNIKECKQEKDLPNFIYKNTKFYCKTCNEYICNGCFTTECIDHDVQWLGNATFRCESPYHKPS